MNERPPGIVEVPPFSASAFLHRLRQPFPDPEHHPGLSRKLNPRDGERILAVVPKHLAVYWAMPLAGGFWIMSTLIMLATWPSAGGQLLWYAAWVGIGTAFVRALREWRDVFVVTSWRVVRVSGILNVRVATMPISRILDMTMTRPLLGRILGYGHFVFESAAQEQGLREIRFVPDILRVDREINDLLNAENKRREKIAADLARRQAEEQRRAAQRRDDVERTDPIEGL